MNPNIPAKAIEDALEKLLDRRQAMSLVAANQEIYHLLRDGFPVEFDNAKGQPQKERVHLINFNEPDKNSYLAVTQLWIKGERGFRRPDVLLTSPLIRPYVRSIVERFRPQTPVISQSEIHPSVRLRTMGQI